MKQLSAAKVQNKKQQPAKLRIWSRWALIGAITATLLPILPAPSAFAATITVGTKDANLKHLEEVYQAIQQRHVSAPTGEKLSEAAIKGMVESLNDPYTKYMNKEEWQAFVDSLDNKYVGIGVRIAEDKKGTYVVEIFSGSPAEKAGVRTGDYIVGVDGASVVGQQSNDIISKIVGKEDTEVTVSFQRDDQTVDFKMPRKAITIPTVTAGRFGGIGYLKVASFSSETDELVTKAIDSWKSEGVLTSLVLDLRGNPGGLVETAQHIAAQFVKEGVLIHTSDRDGKDEPVLIQNGKTIDVPVYILVDGNSASASEVLSGALQDYKVATVLGTQTYGKGSVQAIVELSEGVLKLTVDEYFTPNGRKVNHQGITPDIIVEGGMNQLVSGLRKAGVTKFNLNWDKGVVKLNELMVSDVLPVIQRDGKTFVHSRVLASLIGADLNWNNDIQGMTISTPDGKSANFSVGTPEVVSKDGLTLIDVSAFAEAFPELTWSASDEKVELSSKK